MRARTTASLMAATAMAAGTLAAAGPASGVEERNEDTAGSVSVQREIPSGTVSKAKVQSRGQKVHSANIGYYKNIYPECKPHASTMEKVIWNLGKVTRSSARVKTIKVRYYNERELHVGSAYVHDGNHRQRWLKANGWYISKGSHWRTYKINKTVKFSKNKPLDFKLMVQIAGANEPTWCHPMSELYFYLKPNR
ncbi:hypothetical protein [Streptomyces sp. MZ04]|uniref:hypothetical protein n=1 Tax=Streptomyces sp. MZ04 TaxID=2559236 RepID=UPI00107E96ED|nr:hypothetical protein [Streptomyces sp. MZ04]TGB01345.1 hypothetical protein E2651_27740 [Streptomyces sp. MZ04]